jgi:hypothetical protein
VGDIDGDDREDVVVSGLAMMESDKLPPSIAWFHPGSAGEWEAHWVDYDDAALRTPGDVELADINGDGRLDVVTTSVNESKVYWYENQLKGIYTTHACCQRISPGSAWACGACSKPRGVFRALLGPMLA